MKDLACMLHSTYFGTLQALRKEKSLFAICELSIKGIDEMLKAYFNFLDEKNIPEILEHLESTGIYQELTLSNTGEKYILDIGKCMFAGGEDGVHSTITGIDIPCPIALFMASCLVKENPGKKIYIYPSVYDEWGAVTQIDLISPEEYAERMSALEIISNLD